MAIDFPAASFDAVVALYAIFHLPRGEHARLLGNIRRWLKSGGYLIATLARDADDPYTEDDFFGVEMYWSNYGMPEYNAILAESGFELLNSSDVGHGYTKDAPEDAHWLVIARAV